MEMEAPPLRCPSTTASLSQTPVIRFCTHTLSPSWNFSSRLFPIPARAALCVFFLASSATSRETGSNALAAAGRADGMHRPNMSCAGENPSGRGQLRNSSGALT